MQSALPWSIARIEYVKALVKVDGMTIGIGYFIGRYSNLCFHEAIRKPEALFKLIKAQIVAMKKIDELVQKFLMGWVSIVVIVGIVVFVIGYMNA